MHLNTTIFTDVPIYDKAAKWLLGGVLVSPLIVGIVLIPFDVIGAWLMLGLTAFDALLMWCLLPQRFVVYENRFRVKLGGYFSVNMFFPDITGVKELDKESSYTYWGLKFATSSKYIVEIERKNGLGMIISPSRKEEFIEQLNLARNNYHEPDLDKLIKEKMEEMR